MSDVDSMLALNKVLQKTKEAIHTWFCQVKYSSSRAISMLLTEKANAEVLILQLSNILIWTTKTVKLAVVGMEILGHWQYLKIYKISLERYLGKRNIELLKW